MNAVSIIDETPQVEMVQVTEYNREWLLDYLDKQGQMTMYKLSSGWYCYIEPATDIKGFCPKIASDTGQPTLKAALTQVYDRYQMVLRTMRPA